MLNFLNRWTGGLNHCGTVPLSTPRLILRRFSLDDTRPMFENWACDPDVTQYLTWRAHMTSRETRDVLEYWESQYRRADFYEWAIVPKDYGRPIGSIGMSRLSHSKTSMELGYCIGKAWWGQGICAEAAEAVLRAHGVFGVPVRPCRGNLTDHYDPRDNTIYLSETVYNAPTIAAVGVAAHEAGHAVQYAENYGPVRLRTAIIPATRIGSSLSFILLLVGLVLYSQSLFFIGIVLFSFTTLFQLVTLPVEFNASARAIATIDGAGLLDEDELSVLEAGPEDLSEEDIL